MSDIKFYNSFTRKKEIFNQLKQGEVSMYVCGITPYDYAHIGNARPAIVFDTLYRFLTAMGNKVTYLRNFTDVDDKIIGRANEQGIEPLQLTENFINIYHEDMKKLNVLGAADAPLATGSKMKEPKVTEHIQEIVELITILLDKGFAYVGESGDVLYDTKKFADYGMLSNKKLDELIAGMRVEVSEDKKNPTDFVLWKSAKPEEPQWPFNEKYPSVNAGRPGWHVECSSMINKEFGHSFDIHAGGEDLQFPHHECEIAQGKAAYGGEYARYWLHNAFITVDGDKMGKSLGNSKKVRSILENFSGEAIRLWMLSTHYRKPVDLTEEALIAAEKRVSRWFSALKKIENKGINPKSAKIDSNISKDILKELENDLNTPAAISFIDAAVKTINLSDDPKELEVLGARLLTEANVLGLLQMSPEEYFKGEVQEGDDEIDALVKARNAAKASKNWSEADRIRDELTAKGIILEDSKDGTTWRRA